MSFLMIESAFSLFGWLYWDKLLIPMILRLSPFGTSAITFGHSGPRYKKVRLPRQGDTIKAKISRKITKGRRLTKSLIYIN